MKRYLPSLTPGMHWSIGYHKPQRGPGRVSAYEGVLQEHPGLGVSHTAILLEARTKTVVLTGPATTKKKVAAYHELVAKLQADGCLAPDGQVLELVPITQEAVSC